VISRRDTLRALAAAGVAAPALAACGAGDSRGPGGSAGGSGNDPGGTSGSIRLVSADVPRSAGSPQAVPGTVSSLAAFTTDLWDTLPASDNLAISPYSIAVALAMTANGAAGQTQQQMLDVLHIDSLATYNAGMAALTQEIDGLAGPVPMPDGSHQDLALAAANQLFGDRAMTWERAFLTVLAKQYGAGMRAVDFENAPEAARQLVNRWTAEQTHDRIPEILPTGVVEPSTRLVLVNALYFKAPWQLPFEKGSTSRGAFHRADGSTVTTDLMRGAPEGPQVYLRGLSYAGGRLPYAGGNMAMTLALPDPGREQQALTELLGGGLTTHGETGLAVTMPRWKFRTPTDLTPPLTRLGMTDAFGPDADFSPMTSREPLHISFALHQAFVAVDEKGTEAAAATAVGMADSALLKSHTLVLDRPFLFVIHDTAHGTPLFVGRVTDPS
jgi:serpin B